MTTWPETLPRQTDISGTGVSDDDEQVGAPAPNDDQAPRLTVAAVARRLGVAPATLRTWDRRYGLGPGDHTTGRHRRYGPDDIARLERMQRALLRGASPAEAARYAKSSASVSTGRETVPDVPSDRRDRQGHDAEPVLLSGVLDEDDEAPLEPETTANTGGRGLKLTGAGSRARGLGRAALALDSRSAHQLLLEGFQDDGVVVTWREVLKPVLRALTEQRQRCGSGSEVLPLLVDSASTALRAVIANAPPPLNPRPVVLASVPGEAQELELVVLAAALASRRVGQRLFGTALPKEGLDAVVRRVAPAAVVLWADQVHYAAPRLICELPNTRQRVRAFAAGQGWEQASMAAHVEVLDSVELAVGRITEAVLGQADLQ